MIEFNQNVWLSSYMYWYENYGKCEKTEILNLSQQKEEEAI